MTCTFTNTSGSPTLTVVKKTDPTGDEGNFNLFINSTQHATDVGNNGTTGAQFAIIGTNSFKEQEGSGTSLGDYTSVISGAGCVDDGGGTSGTITLAAGDDKTCTITNTKRGTSPRRLTARCA